MTSLPKRLSTKAGSGERPRFAGALAAFNRYVMVYAHTVTAW